MKIRMLASVPGSIDGIRVAPYEADQEYDLTASAGARELAAAFVGAGLAEEAGAKAAPAPEAVSPADDGAGAPGLEVGDTPAAPKPGRKPKAQ